MPGPWRFVKKKKTMEGMSGLAPEAVPLRSRGSRWPSTKAEGLINAQRGKCSLPLSLSLAQKNAFMLVGSPGVGGKELQNRVLGVFVEKNCP